jgi:hypothetical protein
MSEQLVEVAKQGDGSLDLGSEIMMAPEPFSAGD